MWQNVKLMSEDTITFHLIDTVSQKRQAKCFHGDHGMSGSLLLETNTDAKFQRKLAPRDQIQDC